MDKIGIMTMPADFRYRQVFQKGKPQHDRFDPFRIRHPRMDTGRRAKIFAPFDALKGFSDALRGSEERETEKALAPEGARAEQVLTSEGSWAEQVPAPDEDPEPEWQEM